MFVEGVHPADRGCEVVAAAPVGPEEDLATHRPSRATHPAPFEFQPIPHGFHALLSHPTLPPPGIKPHA